MNRKLSGVAADHPRQVTAVEEAALEQLECPSQLAEAVPERPTQIAEAVVERLDRPMGCSGPEHPNQLAVVVVEQLERPRDCSGPEERSNRLAVAAAPTRLRNLVDSTHPEPVGPGSARHWHHH